MDKLKSAQGCGREGERRLLGVLMPVYNEGRWLDAVLDRVLAQKEVARLVAVDDGSTDDSWTKLCNWPTRDSRVKLIRHDRNRGKGAAIRTALREQDMPLVLIQDADLEYDPADYPRLLDPILSDRADVVYGSRFHVSTRGNPRWHTAGNGLLTWIANRLTGLQLTDEATCYKLFRREILEGMALQEDGFGFCPEVTAKLGKLVRARKVRLLEVPVGYQGRNRDEGKKIRLRDGWEAVRCLWKYSR